METSIAWTHYTFNPWWGCVRVSPGCENCYAETFSHRLGLDLWGPTAGRRFFEDQHWAAPMNWWRRRLKGDKRHLVFCASMADVFEDLDVLNEHRARLWDLIRMTPELTWQLLTKRPQNIMRMVPQEWQDGFPKNVWMLTTAEDQQRFDERAGHLLNVPARVRGISYEPSLGPITFGRVLGPDLINWVIEGGESGAGARPHDAAWSRSVISQCREAGVAPFVKQQGSKPHEGGVPLKLTGKGEDPAEWSEDIRVREFPSAA